MQRGGRHKVGQSRPSALRCNRMQRQPWTSTPSGEPRMLRPSNDNRRPRRSATTAFLQSTLLKTCEDPVGRQARYGRLRTNFVRLTWLPAEAVAGSEVDVGFEPSQAVPG